MACAEGPPERWDLGTGRLEDIVLQESGYYSLEDPGAPANRLRRRRLQGSVLPAGVTLNHRQAEGHSFTELRGRDDGTERVFVFSTKQRGHGLLIAPASCQHLFVEESCVYGKLVTSVTANGTLPCFKGFSGRFSIASDGIPEGTETAPGEVVWIQKADARDILVTLSSGREVLFNGLVPVDRYAHTTPAILFGVLRHGDDIGAARAYMTLDKRWVTANLTKDVRKARVQRLEEQINSNEDIVEVYETLWLDDDFPGHEEVLRLVDEEMTRIFNVLATSEPSRRRFLHGTSILDRSENRRRLDVDGFVARYGAFLAAGQVDGSPTEVAVAEKEFVRRWPEDVATQQLLARKKEADDAQARAETERREQAAAEKREEAEELARCSARCEHKCMHPKFGNKALCREGCRNVECLENECVGYCQADCSTVAKAGQPGCVAACRRGRCGD